MPQLEQQPLPSELPRWRGQPDSHQYQARRKTNNGHTSDSSFFLLSFFGLLGAFTFFSLFLKGARSLASKPGLFGLSSFLVASASTAWTWEWEIEAWHVLNRTYRFSFLFGGLLNSGLISSRHSLGLRSWLFSFRLSLGWLLALSNVLDEIRWKKKLTYSDGLLNFWDVSSCSLWNDSFCGVGHVGSGNGSNSGFRSRHYCKIERELEDKVEVSKKDNEWKKKVYTRRLLIDKLEKEFAWYAGCGPWCRGGVKRIRKGGIERRTILETPSFYLLLCLSFVWLLERL